MGGPGEYGRPRKEQVAPNNGIALIGPKCYTLCKFIRAKAAPV